MTDEEWAGCTDPQKMLAALRRRATARKLRLFAVACCRRIEDFFLTDACLEGVEVAERYADGLASDRERCSARSAVVGSAEQTGITLFETYVQDLIEWGDFPGGQAFMAVTELLAVEGFAAVRVASHAAAEVASGAGLRRDGQAAWLDFGRDHSAEAAAQARLLRDLYPRAAGCGAIDPALLSWHDGLLVSMAQQMYDGRDFGDMPVLADALEEAGCMNPDLLSHCRSKDEHVRGCWVLDALMGRT